MENFVIIIGIFLTAFVALAIGTFVLLKKNKIRFIEKQQAATEINYFENNKKIWLFNTKTTVMIDAYKFNEVFDQFPFLSDFQESKALMLKKRGASSTKIDKVIDDLLTHQSTILRQYQKSSAKLLKGFDKTNLKYNYQNAHYLLKFYNVFLNCYKEQITKNFVNKIMVVELNEVFQNIKIDYDKQAIINKNLDRIAKALNDAVEAILKKLYDDLSITKEEFIFTKITEQTTNSSNAEPSYGKNFDQFSLAYQVLGVSSEISDAELKKAYRKLAMDYHPDKNSDTQAHEMMSKINQAYDLILKVRNLK